MQATRTLTLDDVALDGGLWVLTVVHHPDPARLGGRVVVPCGEALTLGRDAAAGGGHLDDPSVSRRHARVEADDAALRVTDLGSSNGTRVGAVGVREVLNERLLLIGQRLVVEVSPTAFVEVECLGLGDGDSGVGLPCQRAKAGVVADCDRGRFC